MMLSAIFSLLLLISDDENRVKLRQIGNDPLTTYINASMIRVCLRSFEIMYIDYK